jgi:hypothetical protein
MFAIENEAQSPHFGNLFVNPSGSRIAHTHYIGGKTYLFINDTMTGKLLRKSGASQVSKGTPTAQNLDVPRVDIDLLYWSVDEGLLTTNPLVRIRLPNRRRKSRPIMNLAEQANLLDAATPHLRQTVIGALDGQLY